MNLSLKTNKLQKVSAIEIPDRFFNRMQTGVEQLDTIFGGGLLPGMTFTLTATPGTGKTTFFLQLLETLQCRGYQTGYVTGEEDVNQIAFTCKRIRVNEVPVCNETDIDAICELTKELDFLVIDSFPCLTTKKKLNSRKREEYLIKRLLNAADVNQCVIGIVLHITKSGKYKGSTLIPHAVSANFQLDRDEENSELRLFTTQKNRYGRCENLAIYFGAHGFNFSDITKIEDNKKEAKADNKAIQLSAIMEMSDEGNSITQKQVINKLKIDSGKAYLLLKQLTDTDKLIKYGRGEKAVWKKISKNLVENV